MTSYLPASSFPAWSVDKFAEDPFVPLPPSSNTPPQLSNPLPSSPQPSTPSSHGPPSTPPLPPSDAAAAATEQPWAQPTVSTFSTSASLHVIRPYLQNESDPADPVKESGLRLSGAPSQSDDRPRRPANAWILYRSDKLKGLKPTEPSAPRRTQADISKLIAEMWKNETEEIKKYYETLSDHAKAEYHAQYPSYRFQPPKRVDKPRGQKKAGKAELRAKRGNKSRRVVSSTVVPLQERSVNSQLEWPSTDDTLSSRRLLHSHKTVSDFSCAPGFVPYEVPLRSRCSRSQEARKSVQPQSLEEQHGQQPTLPSLVTASQTTSTSSSMPGATVSSEVPTRFVHYWPEQSSPAIFTQPTFHPDRSYAYNTLITPHHEQSSAAPTGWTPSSISYEYSPYPAQSAGSIPEPLPQGSLNPFINLFTNPGATVEVGLPTDFNFDLPELGEFDGFEQWFGPGGLDIAGYPTFTDPTPFQPPHQPHSTAGGHGLTKQESSTRPGVLAYPTPPSCSPPTSLMSFPVPDKFLPVVAPLKTEHPGLYS